MMPEYVFYFFIFPWIAVIASVPGIVITYLLIGVAAAVLNYLPSKKDPVSTE